jgi:cell division protein FtsW (lipid II flippase)
MVKHGEFGEGRVDYRTPAPAAAAKHGAAAEVVYSATGEAKKRRASMDVPFLLLTLVILAIGVVMVLVGQFCPFILHLGNPTYYFMRQLLGFAALGVIVMLLLSRVPMSF